MAVQYQVRAQVVDLRTDQPLATDRFYVDTNVWFWITYPNVQFAAGAPHESRVAAFGGYCQSVLKAGGTLYWCGLSFSELAHGIEGTEFKAYVAGGCSPAFANLKEYRHGHVDERKRVVETIETAWEGVTQLAQPLPNAVVVDGALVDAAIRAMPKLALDGYDYFPLKALHDAKITNVISGDGDFCTAPGITLFTDNRNVLQAAEAQGKLLKR